MTEQLKANWKKLLSYTKSTWTVDDYPLRYKKQTDTARQYNIGELKVWNLQVINWWTMGGLGDTKEEAYENFKTNFKNYLEFNQAPRPGTTIPLSYADTGQIDKLEEIAADFFEKVLDLSYYDCFISDESSLLDFGRDDNETLDKINATYNLGLIEIGDGNIARLLKLIKDKK